MFDEDRNPTPNLNPTLTLASPIPISRRRCVCCLTSFRLYRWYERQQHLAGGLDSVGGDEGTTTGRRKGSRDSDETEEGQPKARFSIPEVKGGITSPGSRRYRVAPDQAPPPREGRDAPAPLQPTRMASDAAAAAAGSLSLPSLSPNTLPLPGVRMGERSSQS